MASDRKPRHRAGDDPHVSRSGSSAMPAVKPASAAICGTGRCRTIPVVTPVTAPDSACECPSIRPMLASAGGRPYATRAREGSPGRGPSPLGRPGQAPERGDGSGHRIVAGVDGPPSSLAALRWAVRQAELTGGSVDAVIAWLPPAASGLAWGVSLVDDTDYGELTAKLLADAISQVVEPGSEVRVRPVAVGHSKATERVLRGPGPGVAVPGRGVDPAPEGA